MNKTRLIIFGAVGLIVVVFILALIFAQREEPGTQVKGNLVIWGFVDETDTVQNFISGFRKLYPGVQIAYQKKSPSTYERELIDALAAGRGPDIFYVHNTWLPKHKDKLFPIYKDYMTPSSFKDTYVDVTYEDFVSDNEVYALPLYADTLALFYNRDIFNSAGIANPPSTWEGLLRMVPLLTQKDESGNITKSAISMGTARNISKAADILSLLMIQSGTQMFNKESLEATFGRSVQIGNVDYPSGKRALEFYTNFANPKSSIYTWSGLLPNSLDAFVEGKAAMTVNYSSAIETIRSKSPHLKFSISLMPQFRDAEQIVNFANYWGVGVSKASKYQDIAWAFLYYMADKDQTNSYLDMTNRPTARRDLIDVQRQENKEIGIFAQQSLSAYSWYQPDSSAVEKIFEEMIESTVVGVPSQDALNAAALKVNSLVKRER